MSIGYHVGQVQEGAGVGADRVSQALMCSSLQGFEDRRGIGCASSPLAECIELLGSRFGLIDVLDADRGVRDCSDRCRA